MHHASSFEDRWEARAERWRSRWARRAARRHHGCGSARPFCSDETPESEAASAPPTSAQFSALIAAVEKLASRVEVLERIVVSDETRLASEIERLRPSGKRD
jgi:hypothetical protein